MKHLLLTASILTSLAAHAAEPPHILLREALQFEITGDSGRVPGTLRLIREHLPNAEVTLWPWQFRQERENELFLGAFPKLRITRWEISLAMNPTTSWMPSMPNSTPATTPRCGSSVVVCLV